MAKRTKVPRASLACTMLDDPDLIALLQDSSGIQGFSVFCLLLMAAKVQDNGGTFKHPTAVIATMVRLPVEAFKVGLATLLSRTDWIIADANMVTVRSYKKWNSWGGSRDNAGRKSSANQDATKPQSKPDVPVSVSVTDTSKTTTPAAPEWCLELATEIARHVQSEFGKNTTAAAIAKWAVALDRLTRTVALAPSPTQTEIESVIRWGLQDRGDGSWAGWSAQIRSTPDPDKFTKIRTSMNNAKRQQAPKKPSWDYVPPSAKGPTW